MTFISKYGLRMQLLHTDLSFGMCAWWSSYGSLEKQTRCGEHLHQATVTTNVLPCGRVGRTRGLSECVILTLPQCKSVGRGMGGFILKASLARFSSSTWLRASTNGGRWRLIPSHRLVGFCRVFILRSVRLSSGSNGIIVSPRLCELPYTRGRPERNKNNRKNKRSILLTKFK